MPDKKPIRLLWTTIFCRNFLKRPRNLVKTADLIIAELSVYYRDQFSVIL